MKHLSRFAQVCCLCILLVVTFSKTNAQAPGAKMNFNFANASPVKDEKANLQHLLAAVPKAVEKPNTISLKAVPLTDDVIKILPQLFGKKVTINFMLANKLTAERVIAIFNSSQIINHLIELEKEYQLQLKTANPDAKKQLAAQWKAINEEAIRQFANAGLKVSESDLAAWSAKFKQLGLNQTFNAVLQHIAPEAGKAASATTAVVSVARITPWSLPNGLSNLVNTVNNTTAASICSKPIASGDFHRDYTASYNYNVNILVWCGDWRHPFRFCPSTLTVFTFSIDIGIDIGYNISCCGVSGWATGSFSACAGAFGYSACVNCTAGGTALIGVAVSHSTSNCTYGFGISLSVNCTILGFTIIDQNYPIYGLTVSAPCPPPGACPK